MKKLAVLVASILVLAGCKVDMETEVNLNDLSAKDSKIVDGHLNFEVPSCTSHEDSRKESNSLIKIKEKVPTIFREAKYVECYSKKFNSYAHFTIPVNVGELDGEGKVLDADVYLFASPKEKIAMGILLTKELRARINKSQKNEINKMDLNFSVKINKEATPLRVNVLGAFMTGADGTVEPMVADKLNWDSNKALTFTLSDVAKTKLLEKGIYPLLVTPGYLTAMDK